MRIVPVNKENVKDFISYCVKYGPEHDESYIPRDDFIPGEDERAYILLNEKDVITGAVSIMLQPEYLEVKRSRFRIFHTTEESFENYKLMLDAILQHCVGIENVFCFTLEDKKKACDIWEKLGFKIKRYSWVLERDTAGVEEVGIPNGFEVRDLREGSDEEAWCEIINSAFADIEGHVRMTTERVADMRNEKEFLQDGMNMLWYDYKPAGLIKLIKTNEDGEDVLFIETLAVHRSFQGKGLGKALLRYGIRSGEEKGLKRAVLTVNAENSNAADLYFKEGFSKTVVYICYNKKL